VLLSAAFLAQLAVVVLVVAIVDGTFRVIHLSPSTKDRV